MNCSAHLLWNVHNREVQIRAVVLPLRLFASVVCCSRLVDVLYAVTVLPISNVDHRVPVIFRNPFYLFVYKNVDKQSTLFLYWIYIFLKSSLHFLYFFQTHFVEKVCWPHLFPAAQHTCSPGQDLYLSVKQRYNGRFGMLAFRSWGSLVFAFRKVTLWWSIRQGFGSTTTTICKRRTQRS